MIGTVSLLRVGRKSASAREDSAGVFEGIGTNESDEAVGESVDVYVNPAIWQHDRIVDYGFALSEHDRRLMALEATLER